MAAAAVTASCGSGPATRAELCDTYDALSRQLLEGNGIFTNPLFRAADKLGKAAQSYEGDAEVNSAGDDLREIADADETTGGELTDASAPIAAECGKPPLTFNALLGPNDEDSPGDGSPGSAPSGAPEQPSAVAESAAVQVDGNFLLSQEDATGRAAPSVTGSSFDGSPVTVGGATGKVTLVAFVAHWAPHAQESVPTVVSWAEANPDVRVQFVSTGANPERPNYPPSAWLASEGVTGDVLVDSDSSDAAVAYGLTALPYFVAINEDGSVAATTEGAVTETDLDRLMGSAR